MDDDAGATPTLNSDIEADVKELMGLFDLPAFARRGQELEHSLKRLHERCRQARGGLLDMVRLRLRQWSGAAIGPEAWSGVFVSSIETLWPLCAAETPRWAEAPAPVARQRDRRRPRRGRPPLQPALARICGKRQPRAHQFLDRTVQSQLCPRKGVRHGLGAAGRALLHAGEACNHRLALARSSGVAGA